MNMNSENGVTTWPTLEELEKTYIMAVLEKENGNKARAAIVLGVTVKTVYNKLDKYATQAPTDTVVDSVKTTQVFG